MNDPAAVYVVGIDAGATRSRALLSAPNRKDFDQVQGPAFNLRVNKPRELRDFIDDAIHRIIPPDRRVDIRVKAIAVGGAGIGTTEEREKVRDVLLERFHTQHVFVHHDAFIAHFGAFSGQPGVMVTAGTGTIAYGRNAEGREARSGGWGWMLGDEGGGWWIAREVLRACLAQWEGTGPATKLTDLLLDHFHINDVYALIPKLYAGKLQRDELITLGEAYATIAREGDEVAREIYQRVGRELANLAIRNAQALEIPLAGLKVALLGGVATGAADLIVPAMHEAYGCDPHETSDECPQLVEPEADAVHGAVNWARELLIKRSYA